MSLLRMVEARLPPGFRFHPREDELVCDYLMRKLGGGGGSGGGGVSSPFPMMIDVDLTQSEPWDLPETACVGGKEWYIFSLRNRKYATGQRTNRATRSGYWKATGKDRAVSRRGVVVGMRKTLVFYRGRAPKGKKTEWVMHEFRIATSNASTSHSHDFIDSSSLLQQEEDWVLCRVSHKFRGGRLTSSSKQTVETAAAAAAAAPAAINEEHALISSSSSLSLPPLTASCFTSELPQLSSVGFEQVPCSSYLNPTTPQANYTAATATYCYNDPISIVESLQANYPHLNGELLVLGSSAEAISTVRHQFSKANEENPKRPEEESPQIRVSSIDARNLINGYYFIGNGLPYVWNS